MNGRIFDPNTASFFSPDPFVQAPDNTQNFNRYSYCLNNPLMYTDPTGEFFIIDSWIVGLFSGGIKEANKRASNDIKIWGGLFQTDSDKNFVGRLWQLVSRFTWELSQTIMGFYYTQGRNLGGNVDRVDYYGGATFATKENASKNNGLSLGSFINMNNRDRIEGSFDKYILTNPMYMHEYGHYIQSQYYGPFYLPFIGIPSLFSAAFSKQVQGEPDGVYTHSFRWYEMQANLYAEGYFGSNYGVSWNTPFHIWGSKYLYLGTTFETFYPRYKRK